MEGGKFIVAILLILVIGGGNAYYTMKQTEELKTQLASTQARIGTIQSNAVNAAAVANAAKASADAATASAAKATEMANQLNTTIADLQKPAPAPAKKK